jgi:hypothetical protein
MDEESRYRTEKPSEDEEKPKVGFLSPLPEAPVKMKGKGAITKFLGITMHEDKRDLLVLILIPLFVAIIDANIYALVIIDALPDSAFYLFVVPFIATIPVGLTAGKTAHGLIGGVITSIFFVVVLMLFLISPALVAENAPLGEFFISGMVVASVYFLFVIFASLLGSLIGALIREFF